jgi:hypothetical protein
MQATQVTLGKDGSRAVVTVISEKATFPEQIEELQSASARELALKAAATAGIKGNPGISGWAESPNPRNSKGQALEEIKGEDGKPLPFNHPDMQPAYYQAAFEITAKL